MLISRFCPFSDPASLGAGLLKKIQISGSQGYVKGLAWLPESSGRKALQLMAEISSHQLHAIRKVAFYDKPFLLTRMKSLLFLNSSNYLCLTAAMVPVFSVEGMK